MESGGAYVIIPQREACVTSAEWCRYKIRLNNDCGERIVPRGYDIASIHMDFPKNEGLMKVQVVIGGDHSVVATLHPSRPQLATFPVYMSKAKYMYTDLVFVYEREWVKSREQYTMVDEYTEEVTYGDEEVEIYDGYEYHTGQVVRRKAVPTGRKVREVTRGAMVTIPEVRIGIQESTGEDPIEVEMRHEIDLKNVDAERRAWLTSKYNLEVDDDASTGVVDNRVRYHQGMAGLAYTF